ncbi:MAG: Crp/Fnr family transcriptional regulator [Anaerovoracaceae bacterium]|jgi:CRP/FNR family transcriptional regulator
MNISDFFPMWDKINARDRDMIRGAANIRHTEEGEVLEPGRDNCTGLILIDDARLRIFILSEEGREVTLFRLGPGSVCLLSASCMFNGMSYDINIITEKSGDIAIVPTSVYKAVSERSAPLANFTSQIMAERFESVMWLIEQILWKSFDARLAEFLLDEADLEGTNTLSITHEQIAYHLGTAREVVTRMLKYFVGEGYVALARGSVTLTDVKALRRIAEN